MAYLRLAQADILGKLTAKVMDTKSCSGRVALVRLNEMIKCSNVVA